MRWTSYFIPTTKETPKDATAASHVLMLRAGLIRQLAAGTYTYLPLGLRVLRNVESIVREELNRAGAIELHMPAMHPQALWDESGRTPIMGDVLLRLAGPPGDWRAATVLGPTHEEVITEIARAYLNSYKQLPVNFYQIQTKFRGEARPKSGVLRTREFLMKDAYSFHADKTSLDEGYQKMYDAYCRIFSRCGLPYVAVEADSGAIGGDASHEFMVLTEAGEDVVAISENGDYAANTERATAHFSTPSLDERLGQLREMEARGGFAPLREVHTPGAGRIEDVCAVLGTSPSRMIKTLIYDLHAVRRVSGRETEVREWVVALVRGDHEVNEIKLKRAVTASLTDHLILGIQLATPDSIERLTGAAVGFAGPQGLVDRVARLVVDRDVTLLRDACSGANRTDYHVTGVTPGHDFPITGERVAVADIRMVVAGDLSPTGSAAPLQLRTAIEVGHVFKLGTKYSEAMRANFLTPQGKPQPFIMGCYGIGLNRIVAAAIEAHHDEAGIRWPAAIAPFRVLLISLDPKDADVIRIADDLYAQLASSGIDTLYDDRDERAGFKFKDADLIGIPLRLVIGKKSLADGHVEFSRRSAPGEKALLSPAAALEQIRAAVRSPD